MKYFSMFTGVGGFELGIERATKEIGLSRDRGSQSQCGRGEENIQPKREISTIKESSINDWQCVGFSEIDKYASELLKQKFPTIQNYGDATKINPNELPNFDLLCGGFPCQAFSIAGKRKGFQDTRGTLFFEIARIVKVKRPKIVFLENVKGLLNHQKGKTFRVIIQTLSELGYDVQWMVLNSKFFGVPQNRERVFIIGSLRGESRPEILPLKYSDGQDIEIEGYLNDKGWNKRHENIRRIYGTENAIAPTIPTAQGGGVMTKIVASRGRNPMNPSDRTTGSQTEQRLEPNSKGISNTLSSVQKDNLVLDTPYSMGATKPNRSTIGSRRVPEVGTKEQSIRRLTPIECERLQGFPQYESFITFNIHNNICQLDLQKSYANVESQNLKQQNVVGNVGNEDLKESVLSAKQNLNLKNQQINKPVQENVLITCEEERVEILNQGKSLNYADFVESQKSYLPQIKKEDFVQMIVGINSICEKIINLGRGELLQNEQSLIQVENGKISVKLSGNGMMQLVRDVKKDSTMLKEHLKYITSNPLNINNLDSNWTTSFSYVISAIIGCILQETKINNSLNLQIKSRFGYTFGFSDTQRYKMMGNAVTVNVVEAIVKQF